MDFLQKISKNSVGFFLKEHTGFDNFLVEQRYGSSPGPSQPPVLSSGSKRLGSEEFSPAGTRLVTSLLLLLAKTSH